jgi:hypothetical protein
MQPFDLTEPVQYKLYGLLVFCTENVCDSTLNMLIIKFY